jgi:hypothetical protein
MDMSITSLLTAPRKMSRNVPSIHWFAAGLFVLLLPAGLAPASPPSTRVAGANVVDAYRVPWWGAEGSQYDRPIHHVLRINNGRFELHHGIVPGRPLADYRLPYWPIRSFVSVVSGDAELPHVPQVQYTLEDKRHTQNLVVQEGFELASGRDADILKVTNRGNDDRVLLEHLFVVRKGNPVLEVVVRATNRCQEPLRDVTHAVFYHQGFNWSHFGAAGDGKTYLPLEGSCENRTNAFFAHSSGMERGYELIAGQGCELAYRIDSAQNRWHASLTAHTPELKPGQSVEARHRLRVLREVPRQAAAADAGANSDLQLPPFFQLENLPWKQAPVAQERRVTLAQVIAGMARGKTRGLNLRTSRANADDDLQAMKEWGANLVILPLGNAEQLVEQVVCARRLGMEVFAQGRGAYHKQPPTFEPLWEVSPSPEEMPDSFGQDEDHYYWHQPVPARDFQTDFGHPPAQATQEEKVRYWSACMRDKWTSVLKDVREHAPEGDIWFYTPAPSIAHVDPLDYYDAFFRALAKLGEPLTVFPFYYGIEYNQAEYMMRRCKDAGIPRAVFLPMRGFLAKPSQFFRVITAARRGGADGACGFNFAIAGEKPDNAWQWKSVLLAAWANFPTPELDAVAFLEEPAQLVEALAGRTVLIDNRVLSESDAKKLVERLDAVVPHGVRLGTQPSDDDAQQTLVVRIGSPELVAHGDWPFRFDTDHPARGKGVIQMSGSVVSCCGRNAESIQKALALLARFAELAQAEAGQ